MGFFDYDMGDQEHSVEQIAVLQNLTETDWQMVIRFGQSINFEAGQVMLEAGDTEDAVYIIISGQVEVIKMGSFGMTHRLALIDEGSVFGELAFFDNQPRSASIWGVIRGQVLKISRKGFEQIAAWNPPLAQKFLFDLGRILAHRFRIESPYKI